MLEDGYDFEVSTGTYFSYNNWLEGELVFQDPLGACLTYLSKKKKKFQYGCW